MKIGNGFKVVFFVMVLLYNGIVLSQSRDAQSRVWNIVSLQDALINVRKVIDNFPSGDSVAAQVYEEKQSYVLVKCARVLYDNARQQVLVALQEIDNRNAYWQHQKDHQWQYFLTKNPLKWITGKSQEEEVQNNLELLESHQGELYVLLGQLAECGNAYDHGYKTSFLSDYKKGYEWIDGLLDLLSRIKTSVQSEESNALFLMRAIRLKLKLEGVGYFKDDILSDTRNTQIPPGLERNWLIYGTLMLGLGLGYNMGGVEKLKKSFDYFVEEGKQYIVTPVQNIVKDVFVTGQSKDDGEWLVPQKDIEVAKESIKTFVDNLKVKDKSWFGLGTVDNKDVEGIVDKETGNVNTAKLQVLADKFLSSGNLKKVKKGAEATALWVKLLGLEAGSHAQEQLADIQKQYAGVGKIAFLTPAVFTGGLAYSGYQKLTTKDYSILRQALLDINSLFVDQSKPLDDEHYGKMVYLLYTLKNKAEKKLPTQKNIRVEFLQDLENIESKEFDVAAKRRIIDDMFRKYSFLGFEKK